MRTLPLVSIALLALSPAAFAAGDAAAGKAKSTVCAACHGPDGNKPIDANTPKLAAMRPPDQSGSDAASDAR